MTGLMWHACEQPERPPDPYVVWHYMDCRGCRIKIEALEAAHPDDAYVASLARLIRELGTAR